MRRSVCLLLVVLLGLVAAARSWAGTTGKLTGRVVDETGEGVIGATVLIVGTGLGAAADLDGRYVVLNIPAGTYTVRFSAVGFAAQNTASVVISADQTTTLNATLRSAAVQVGEVEVVAQRPVVELNQTSTVVSRTAEQIAALPVQSLADVVNLQAGVVDGHFRGGRTGEVQYQVDGVTVNNPYDNSSTLRLDRSVLQEVQVVSGTFDAEYGQAMSGVVNAILKTGGEHFEASGEVYVGDFIAPDGRDRFPHIDQIDPLATQSYQLTLSGPTGLPGTTFLASGRRATAEGYLYGRRLFSPTDSSDAASGTIRPTGDNAWVPLADQSEWSGLVKLTHRFRPGLQASYQAVGNRAAGGRYSQAYRLNPDGATRQRSYGLTHGLDLTQTLTPTLFYTLALRQNIYDYQDFAYADVTDPRYVAAGLPTSNSFFNNTALQGVVVQGVDPGRFTQRTNALVIKSDVTGQFGPHLLKLGIEGQRAALSFGAPGVLTAPLSGSTRPIPRPDSTTIRRYAPLSAAIFAQDRIEWRDLVVRAGVRVEAFDARATVPSNFRNPANTIQGEAPSVDQPTTVKWVVAPRIGLSYPITDRGAIYVSYGHFHQLPGLGQLYSNADYSILRDLQAFGTSYGVLGYPDLKPERTTQYEVGLKQALTDDLGATLTLFSKDIRDLLGVRFERTANEAEYARFTNIDFGGVTGGTISLDARQLGPVAATVDYTLQLAKGSASDPRETATRAQAGQDARPRETALSWDQRHTLNTTVTLARPGHYTLSAIVRLGSGQPYTPSIGSGFGSETATNSGRKPGFAIVDLRGEVPIQVGAVRLTGFARVFNLLGTRTVNGFVFDSTGSADYVNDQLRLSNLSELNNPSRFAAPRRVEIGITASGTAR